MLSLTAIGSHCPGNSTLCQMTRKKYDIIMGKVSKVNMKYGRYTHRRSPGLVADLLEGKQRTRYTMPDVSSMARWLPSFSL